MKPSPVNSNKDERLPYTNLEISTHRSPTSATEKLLHLHNQRKFIFLVPIILVLLFWIYILVYIQSTYSQANSDSIYINDSGNTEQPHSFREFKVALEEAKTAANATLEEDDAEIGTEKMLADTEIPITIDERKKKLIDTKIPVTIDERNQKALEPGCIVFANYEGSKHSIGKVTFDEDSGFEKQKTSVKLTPPNSTYTHEEVEKKFFFLHYSQGILFLIYLLILHY